MAFFNEIDPNDLMVNGTPGYMAAQHNVLYLGYIFIFIAMAVGFWLGSRPVKTDANSKGKWVEIAVILAVTIAAGTLMGLPGGITIVFWMAIAGGIGFIFGKKRRTPSGE